MKPNQLIKILECEGRIVVDSAILTNLIEYKNNKEFASRLLKVKYDDDEYLYSATLQIVKHWATSNLDLTISSIPGLNSTHDVVNKTYEGGFKIWESCKDLISFIANDKEKLIENIYSKYKIVEVLELGAGSSLPSLMLLKKAKLEQQSRLRITLHDYNWHVLATSALINLAMNIQSNIVADMLSKGRILFEFGPWEEFQSKTQYGLILMSEVIYNSDNYDDLHRILCECIRDDGLIIMANKETYFGCSGDMLSWLEFIKVKGNLEIVLIEKTASENIPRSVIVLRKLYLR